MDPQRHFTDAIRIREQISEPTGTRIVPDCLACVEAVNQDIRADLRAEEDEKKEVVSTANSDHCCLRK